MPINPEDLLARLQLNDDDLRDIETTFKDGKEDLSECVICKEDIFDILREAEKDNKGGMEGSLSLWVCELASCGAVYCLSCVIRWTTERSEIHCPSCTRPWDAVTMQSQKDSYEEMNFEWHQSKT
ncbi:hypothetical protein I203_106611 [Kwoniella mangroviensis CBS 8507]|uniref:uncharacterized protein n=1 Tax=Kwoniella mangroviensis CBS 8507 TaxID=1296122 RepID=UPI00306E1759